MMILLLESHEYDAANVFEVSVMAADGHTSAESGTRFSSEFGQ